MKIITPILVSLLFMTQVIHANLPVKKELEENYQAKDFTKLIGMPGFSEKALQMHFKLYQGYVKNINLLLEIIQGYSQDGKDLSPQYAEIKRRLGWEFDGMRLHELYFENLGGKGTQINLQSDLYQQISMDFKNFDAWKKDFMATGAMRGIGWVILTLDPVQNRLINVWIGEHDIGHLAGTKPILIMDVWEHAYMIDYGLERADYIRAFFENINWDVVQSRF